MLTKRKFEILIWVLIAILIGPLAWHVHSTYSLGVQALFYGAVVAISLLIRRVFYVPIHSRLPD